jgi:tRNA (cytidine/uridine-2'-O-)-methyltransferase
MMVATSNLCIPPHCNVVVVLVEPQIPENTGNIRRLITCTGADLWIVGKTGFQLDDKKLKRCAMDYAEMSSYRHTYRFEDVLEAYPKAQPFFLSSNATRSLWELPFPDEVILVFGSETHGLPIPFVRQMGEGALRIPMVPEPEGRSLNLSNAVSIVLYEVLRQQHCAIL